MTARLHVAASSLSSPRGRLVHLESAAVVEARRVTSVAHHEVGSVVVKTPLAAPDEDVWVLSHGGRRVDERGGDVGRTQGGRGTQQTLTIVPLNTARDRRNNGSGKVCIFYILE